MRHNDGKPDLALAGFFLILTVGFISFVFWGAQYETVTGTVSGISWKTTVSVQEWVTYTDSDWRENLIETNPIFPHNGEGERVGVTILDCYERYYDTIEVPKGTSKTCKKVNGVEQCVTEKTYKKKAIEKLYCDYETQRWVHVDTWALKGNGHDIEWPEVALGESQRSFQGLEFYVGFSYSWEGAEKTYVYKTSEQPSDINLGDTLTLRVYNSGIISID